MYQSDYILRMIEQVGVMLRAMIAALREARPDDVLELSDEALELTLGMGPDVFDSLTGEGLVTLLGAGGPPDPARALLVGETLVHRASALTALEETERATWETERARAVLQVVVGGGSQDQQTHALELLGALAE